MISPSSRTAGVFRRWPLALAALLAFAQILPAQTHRRVYMLGNSLTDDVVYEGFTGIVNGSGNTLTLGSHRTPGAPVFFLWNNPGGSYTQSPFGYYPNAFANYTWDAVTLQPFSTYSNEMTASRWFAQALRGEATFGDPNNGDTIMDVPTTPGPGVPTGINPNATIYIYAQWPSNITGDWKSSTWLANTPTGVNTAAYFDAFVPELRSLEPKSKFFLIPVGHVFHELYQQTRAGRFPGITSQADLMADDRHLNNRGSYVAALTFFSVIYRADPRGLTVPPPYIVTPEQAAVIQQAVWKVVNLHPLTGLRTTLTITTPSLPDALQGTAFTTTLASAQASGAVTWSVSAGELPGGVTLAGNGTLSGTPTASGNYLFTARAQDAGGNSVERDFILFVRSNNPPVITTTSLPAAPRGAAYRQLLATTGGFGDITWALKSGDLPTGLTLGSDGLISGAPTSVTGNYSITVTATDSLPGTPSVGERTLALTVTAPEAGTLFAAPLSTPPTVNGTLVETFWTLPHTANRRLVGAGDNTASFSVRWTSTALHVAARVVDGQVRPEDAVHLFLDSRHDRELAYNSDDRHLVVYANGTWEERNNRPSGITAAAASTPDGYSVEVTIPLANLERSGSATFTMGFDLGVEDVDAANGPVAYQAWLGTSATAPVPVTMGNLVLAAGPLGPNILVNGNFSAALLTASYAEQKANTSRAGLGWYRNGVAGRPFTVIDKLGYGFPNKAIIPNGSGSSCTMYQVVADAKATKGRGYLRMDVKIASPHVNLRLFAYNGTATQVDAKMGTLLQQNPPTGGTPDATLLSTNLANVPVSTTWREVVLPVDFGSGYDYYVVAMGAPADTTTTLFVPLDTRIDNVELGAEQPEQAVMTPEPTPTVTVESVDPAGAELGANAVAFRVRRDAASPFAIPVAATYGGTAQAGVDYRRPDAVVIPGRSASVDVELAPISDRLAEGAETVTFGVDAQAAYTRGTQTSGNGTIADHPVDAWHFTHFGATPLQPGRDSDQDGTPDLVEVALGSDPFSAASRPELRLGPGSTAGRLELSLPVGGVPAGVVSRFESSSDLVTWSALPFNDARLESLPALALPDGRQQRRWQLQPTDFGAGSQLFLRLRADREE